MTSDRDFTTVIVPEMRMLVVHSVHGTLIVQAVSSTKVRVARTDSASGKYEVTDMPVEALRGVEALESKDTDGWVEEMRRLMNGLVDGDPIA